MSRIGKLPITVPSGVVVAVDDSVVTVKGPKGTLSHTVAAPITVARGEDGALEVARPNDERISKPGLRVYAKSTHLPKVLGGLGVAIISTSQGLLTDRQANKTGVGGEVLAYVW